MWEFGYTVSDGNRRMRAFYNFLWPYLRRSLRLLLHEHPADLIVSVHQLVNTPIMRARVNRSTRFVTVVTDLVSTHAAWYHPGADLVIVPTQMAREKALKSGLAEEKVVVIGQPVAERYIQPLSDAESLRERLNWKAGIPTVLMVGGGEGMGNIERYAYAINDAKLSCQLIVVAGRNERTRHVLNQHHWNIPFHVYGFVNEMPEFMRAADIIITKAGPGTISEAFIAGLPVILFARLPGQETGNVDYVVQNRAGAWAPEPDQVVQVLRMWLDYPNLRQEITLNSKRLAKPLASRQIARALAREVQIAMSARM